MWTEIAENVNQKTQDSIPRLGKHCRERWMNHLDKTFKKWKKYNFIYKF